MSAMNTHTLTTVEMQEHLHAVMDAVSRLAAQVEQIETTLRGKIHQAKREQMAYADQRVADLLDGVRAQLAYLHRQHTVSLIAAREAPCSRAIAAKRALRLYNEVERQIRNYDKQKPAPGDAWWESGDTDE